MTFGFLGIFGMCTTNPTAPGTPRHTDTKADLILKHLFCNYLQVVGTTIGCCVARSFFLLHPVLFPQCHCTDVGHGLVGTLFLSLFLLLVPNPNYIMLCYVILAKGQRIGVRDGLAR